MAFSVRAALYAALVGDPELVAMLGDPLGGQPSIFHQVAPLAAGFPVVIFAKQAGNPRWTFAGPPTDSELWMVKAINEGESASAAETIAGEIDRVLTDAALTIDGRGLLWLRRESDVDYLEQSGPDLYHHVGGIYRLITERT